MQQNAYEPVRDNRSKRASEGRVEVLSDLIVKLLFYQSTTLILKGERNAVVL